MTHEKTLQTKQGTHSQAHSTAIHYHLTFITLTLPSTQAHSDKEIKAKCLNTFLNTLRRKHKSELYIWKAEKQENGNIHFHIICDKYIHWTTIRTDWNRIVNKLGYVDRYSEKMKKYYKNGFRLSDNPNDKRTQAQQFASYTRAKKTGYTNPNSTDIHALYKIKNLAAYISKYMAKGVTKTDRINQINQLMAIAPSELSDQQKQQLEKLKNQGVQGRIWGCSQRLSKASNYTELCNWSDIQEIDKVLKYKTGTYITEVGEQEIVTYTFDIHKFPKLKQILSAHLSKCVQS